MLSRERPSRMEMESLPSVVFLGHRGADWGPTWPVLEVSPSRCPQVQAVQTCPCPNSSREPSEAGTNAINLWYSRHHFLVPHHMVRKGVFVRSVTQCLTRKCFGSLIEEEEQARGPSSSPQICQVQYRLSHKYIFHNFVKPLSVYSCSEHYRILSINVQIVFLICTCCRQHSLGNYNPLL